jgi:RNA polymerase sigma factor (sigma-70 family)
MRDVDVARVYAEEADRLRRVAYLMVGRREAAEEIVHDAFARTYGRWASIDNPGGYLRTTVVNLCVAWQRRATMERERTPRPDRLHEPPPELDEMWALLQGLPPDLRAVLVLRFYEDLPDDEIARVVGCARATVRTRVHRAIRQLREEMTP